MASKTWGQFSSYWICYCKDTAKQLWYGDQCTHFSEGLLKTIYYETDVGCIPRGIQLDTTKTQPKYLQSGNWNKQINSCYWCKDDSTSHNGICCSKECFFYLHDWCVERVVYFTGRRFCRLPGCDNNTHNKELYCDDIDRAKFDSLFSKGSNHEYTLKTVIREGPSWYNVRENIIKHSQNNDNSQNKMKNKKTSSINAFKSDFPSELQELISLQTDIGIIPRDAFSLFQLQQPKFSHYPNWSTTIKGCYFCGKADIIDSTNKYFCRVRCYLIFYEWCRSKVESVTGIRFCQHVGCPKRASEGYQCCNKEHDIRIKQLYKTNSVNDVNRLSTITPEWYKKSNCPNELVPHLSPNSTHSQTPSNSTYSQAPSNSIHSQTPSNSTYSQTPSCYNQPPQQVNCGPNFIFSSELTKYLYFQTDVGPIPREVRFHRPPPESVPLLNWNINITMCYWCCQGPRSVHSIACSYKCLFFFNEWLHKIYETSSNRQLCKSIGCDSHRYPGFQCCNRDHSSYYDSSFKQFYNCLKSTEFALGPMWYTDLRTTLIKFYNREDPFYEFTNFYPCDNLYIDELRWRTSEHYFQAMKFYGTPYFRHVSTMTSPRDAFQFSRTPEATKWLHPQWSGVKLQVMLKVLRVKFSSNHFRTILLRTGDAPLVEHTRNDRFWGDGGDGFGENKLGILLMQVRRELQATNMYPVYQQNPMFQDNINNQTLLTYVANNQNTNVVHDGGANPEQHNVSLNSPPHPPQANTPSSPSQSTIPSLPPQAPVSYPIQSSAPRIESNNTNSEHISNVIKVSPSTNPFDKTHENYSKTTNADSKHSSTKAENELLYSAKHDLPTNYTNPFDPIDDLIILDDMETNQNESQTISSNDSGGKSLEIFSANVVIPGPEPVVTDKCDETNNDPFGKFIVIDTSGTILSTTTSNAGDDDNAMETEPSTIRLIPVNQSESYNLPKFGQFNPFAKDVAESLCTPAPNPGTEHNKMEI